MKADNGLRESKELGLERCRRPNASDKLLRPACFASLDKKGKHPAGSTTVTVEITRIKKGAFSNEYEIRIPGCGYPGCLVLAKNASVAKKAVAEFIYNELMDAGELTS